MKKRRREEGSTCRWDDATCRRFPRVDLSVRPEGRNGEGEEEEEVEGWVSISIARRRRT